MYMNLYVFFTMGISQIGGVQCYVSSKTKRLKECGWDVKLLFGGVKSDGTPFENLKYYRDGAVPAFFFPPGNYPRWIVQRVIRNVLDYLGEIRIYEKIVIESHDDRESQWGEIIANKIGAKHVIVLMNEIYRGADKYYEDKIDFYKYKFSRKEILGDEQAVLRLFEGYDDINIYNTNPFVIDENPVADIANDVIDGIERLDYNICYIGRALKPYVPNIIKGVKAFCYKHKQAYIQFILVSDVENISAMIENELNGIENVKISPIGEMIPIPRDLFKCIDVVVAGSGSARCAAAEGVLTLVAEPELCKSTGILGVDTMESIYWDGESECLKFEDALEKVLIKREYEDKEVKFKMMGGKESTRQNFEAIKKSSSVQEYYDIEKLLDGDKTNYIYNITKLVIMDKFPLLYSIVKKYIFKRK